MAEGSSQTIDRIQVELSANVGDLISDLKKVETQTSNAVAALSHLESKSGSLSSTASQVSSEFTEISTSINTVTASITASSGAVSTYSDTLGRAGGYTASFASEANDASEQILTIADASEQASDSLEAFSQSSGTSALMLGGYYKAGSTAATATSNLSKTTKSASGEMKSYGSAVDTAVEELDKAGNKTDEESNKLKTTAEKFKNIFDTVKKIGSAFGVSIGLGLLIDQVNDLKDAATDASKAYGNLHNKIYYNIGELTESQQTVADKLMAKGYGESNVSEAISKVAIYYPNAENTYDENGVSYLESISEEIIQLDRKGFGDISSIIEPMNTAFKRFGITQEKAIDALAYVRSASQDTGLPMDEILQFATDMDEMASVLNLTFKDVVDFVSNANVAGNIQDLSGAGLKFETQYYARVEDAQNALLEGDLDTLKSMGVSADKANKLISQVDLAMEEGAEEGTAKAKELATDAIKELFQSILETAKNTNDKKEISSKISELTGLPSGRISTSLADVMMASNTNEDIRYTNRQNSTPLVTVISDVKGPSYSDAADLNAASKSQAMKDMWIGKIDYNEVMTEAAYNLNEYNAFTAHTLAKMGTSVDELSMIGQSLTAAFPALSIPLLGTQYAETQIINSQGVEETQKDSSILNQIAASRKKYREDFFSLFSTPGGDAGTNTLLETLNGIEDSVLGFFENISFPDLSKLSPIGAASAAEEVVFDQSLNGLNSEDTAKAIEDAGKAAEEAMEPVQTFTVEASDPLATSVGTVMENIAGVLEQDTKYQEGLPDLQESLGNETTSVNNLATAYWNLAAAKAAAGSA